MIPASAVAPIVAASRAGIGDIDSLVDAARRAGSLAIPLVKRLTAAVAERDAAAAAFVHHGSTSQDVIDTAMVLATKRALGLIDTDLARFTGSLHALARAHLATPMLARTLLQPAQVISFGFKIVAWLAPLVRARARLARAQAAALRLQFGGAAGTLASLGDKGSAVARRIAAQLGVAPGDGAWHVQRDDWVALGCEVGEVAEPSGGGSSAMPQKKNPVAAMTAIAAAVRAPHRAAALLVAMGQPHERGLGEWQAELAEWPSLFLETHGALVALADACAGLDVNADRMRDNIERQHGTVFAEAAAALLVPSLGKAKANELLATLSTRAAAAGGLRALLRADPVGRAIDAGALDAAFDVDAAARRAGALAAAQLDRLAPSLPRTATA